MEFLRRYWTQVAAQLGELTATQTWLILSLTVVLLLSGFVMLQYAAAPEMVPITGFSSDHGNVFSHLAGRGVKVRSDGGQLLVPRDQVNAVLYMLEEGKLLRPDTSAAFDELIKSTSPFMSESSKKQHHLIARQKVLANIIEKMQDVDSADVLISMPPVGGFGETAREPSASVSVVMERGQNVVKPMVKAIAGLVSGANAPMNPQAVVVVDANRNQSFTVKDESDLPPSDTFALRKKIEGDIRDKIVHLLQIHGLVVAVNVETDNTLRETIVENEYQDKDQVASEMTRETNRTETADGGEPGARSNTSASIAGGAAEMTSEITEEMDTKFAGKQLTSQRSRVEVGHQLTATNVSLNVPREYFVALQSERRISAGADPEDPADGLDPQMVNDELEEIESLVETIVRVTDGTWEVRARMMVGGLALAPFSDGDGTASGVVQLVGSEWIKTGAISLLAVVSLALMFGMVRRATAPPDQPTIEELAGLPPPLGDDELIGEADELRTVIDGVEISDDEMRSRKIAEQISDMVNANPEEAGNLLGRWVRRDA